MSNITSALWWKAATIRAVRTAIVVALPFLPASLVADIPYLSMASAAALGVILSYLTSLAGISETDDKTPTWWYAVFSRVVRTTAQAVVAGLGTSILITDVDWTMIGQTAIASGFGSLLLAVLTQLPEAEVPTAVAAVNTVVVNEAGVQQEVDLPLVAAVSSENLTPIPNTASADSPE